MFKKAVRQHILKKKPSLGTLLHETLQKQWDEIKNAMILFSYFDDWSEEAVHQCCVHSNILHYSVNEIVYGKDDANVDVTHFILEGNVIVVMRMLLEKYRTKYHKITYKLHKDQSLKTINSKKLKPVFMQICRLNEGACFGLGEKLSQHIIIANSELKCLVVPRSLILRNKTALNAWERIVINLDQNTPSIKQIFYEYKEAKRRLQNSIDIYKCGYYGKYNRIPVNTNIHDVPLILRSSSILYANRYKLAKNHPMYLVGEKKEENISSNSNKQVLEELKDILSTEIFNDNKPSMEETKDALTITCVTFNESKPSEEVNESTTECSNDNKPLMEESKNILANDTCESNETVLAETEDMNSIEVSNTVLEEKEDGDVIEASTAILEESYVDAIQTSNNAGVLEESKVINEYGISNNDKPTLEGPEDPNTP